MAIATIQGIRIAGLSVAEPEIVSGFEDVAQVFGEETALKIKKNTGVQTRHIAPSSMCASDLCEAAARQLLEDLDWSSESVDLVIFVSQTPDYRLPATACVLQGKLGFSKQCAAFDINLGCSGYVYGLWIISQLLTSGSFQRGLLLVGDTITRTVSPHDRSTAPLFGDAGTATALERNQDSFPMCFELGTDGIHAEHLIIPSGGYRQPSTLQTSVRTEREGGNIRSDDDLYMNGAEIFTFTLREVPSMLNSVMTMQGWDADNVDAFVLHQANRFMLNHIVKRMNLPTEKVPYSIEDHGNTSSATLPLTMSQCLGKSLRTKELNLVLGGFGVGLSWGAAALKCGPMIISKRILLPEKRGSTDAHP
jgi:3-oxoacyl-[acyl-carrier-protein] synthase-3